MLEFVGRERRWVDKNKTGRVLQNVFRRDWLIGSVFGFEDDAAILEADRSVEHSFGHLDRCKGQNENSKRDKRDETIVK